MDNRLTNAMIHTDIELGLELRLGLELGMTIGVRLTSRPVVGAKLAENLPQTQGYVSFHTCPGKQVCGSAAFAYANCVNHARRPSLRTRIT